MPNTEEYVSWFPRAQDGADFRLCGRIWSPLLLHSSPQTEVMWHKIAPGLAEEHSVVVAGSSLVPVFAVD